MKHSTGSAVTARERARKANAQRLADEQNRLKNQEEDLISYFDATRDEEKVELDLSKKIAKLRADAAARLNEARSRRAVALASLKDSGETYTSVSSLVDLPISEATKLIRSARTSLESGSTSAHHDDDDTLSDGLASEAAQQVEVDGRRILVDVAPLPTDPHAVGAELCARRAALQGN